MSFAYNFFVGTVRTLGFNTVFSSMANRGEMADLMMEMYRLQTKPSGLSDKMTYHPSDIVGLLHLQAASLLFKESEELRRLRGIKRENPEEYRKGIENLAVMAYVEARDMGRDINASGSTVRKFLAQFPA